MKKLAIATTIEIIPYIIKTVAKKLDCSFFLFLALYLATYLTTTLCIPKSSMEIYPTNDPVKEYTPYSDVPNCFTINGTVIKPIINEIIILI